VFIKLTRGKKGEQFNYENSSIIGIPRNKFTTESKKNPELFPHTMQNRKKKPSAETKFETLSSKQSIVATQYKIN
jgi:hypothetical protein